MALNDLPPWLSGESDRGFLQGAQLGITAARTGTDMAATRQQMRESAELQPFRVAAAELQNNLQRQQFDLGAATFANKVLAADLVVKGQIAGLKSSELDITRKARDLANWERDDENNTIFDEETESDPLKILNTPPPRLTTPEGIRRYEEKVGWAGKTIIGQANANAFKDWTKTYQEAVALNPKLVSTLAPLVKDGMPTEQAWDVARAAVNAGEKAKQTAEDARKVNLARELGKVSTEFKLEIEKARQDGKLEVIQQQLDKRADDAVNQSDDVNARIAFQEAMKLARSRGDMVEQERLVNEFKLRKKGGMPAPDPSNASKLVTEATDAYNEAYVAGDAKKLPELEAKAMRAKVLELKASGKVLNPNRPDQWNFAEGEWVVFPANKNATKMVEREEHVRQFSKDAAVKLLKERQRIADKAVEDDKANRERAKTRGENLRALGETSWMQ